MSAFRHVRVPGVLFFGGWTLVLAGCGASTEQTRAATVVTVGDAKLPGSAMERWLVGAPVRPTRRNAAMIASAWIDQTLLAAALTKSASLDDSTTIDAAILPDAERGATREFWQARAAARPPVTDRAADSLANTDRVRVFQRLVIALSPHADSATRAAAVQKARVLLKRAQTGGDFTTLVRENSQDSSARTTGGMLPAMTRQDVPQQIASAIWTLHPGEFSPLLQTPVGLQIVRRVTRLESRPGLKAYLAPVFNLHADSLYLDSLTRARHVKVAGDAVARVRGIAEEPVNAPADPPLATWDGGSLTTAMTRKWLLMVTPAERGQITVASDSAAEQYVKDLAQRELMVSVAMPAGDVVSPQARAALAPAMRRALGLVEADLRRTGGTRAPGDMAVAYLDSATTGKVEFHLLPGALASVLRTRAAPAINYAQLDAVVKLAANEWDLRRAQDTVRPPAPKQ
ncbi:MAG TPA: peptidylprolyl isomerase [Gemmatimonadales bacterium]|jgi:hypothetical protein|nr:peptidylprolyl isomerase [Gemmatimonadales bacterium]